MGVGSRFDQPLTLISDGHQVIACGPLGFEGCDTHADVSISLHQGSHGQAHASGTFVNSNRNEQLCDQEVGDDEDEWMLTADVSPEAVGGHLRSASWSSFAFAPTPKYGGSGDPVRAHGVIVYHRKTGGGNTEVWDGDVDHNDLEVRWQ